MELIQNNTPGIKEHYKGVYNEMPTEILLHKLDPDSIILPHKCVVIIQHSSKGNFIWRGRVSKEFIENVAGDWKQHVMESAFKTMNQPPNEQWN